jgi:hypothetical protein
MPIRNSSFFFFNFCKKKIDGCRVAKTLKDLFLLLRGNNFVPFFFFFQKIIYAVDIVWNYFVLVDFVVLEFIWLYL